MKLFLSALILFSSIQVLAAHSDLSLRFCGDNDVYTRRIDQVCIGKISRIGKVVVLLKDNEIVETLKVVSKEEIRTTGYYGGAYDMEIGGHVVYEWRLQVLDRRGRVSGDKSTAEYTEADGRMKNGPVSLIGESPTGYRFKVKRLIEE